MRVAIIGAGFCGLAVAWNILNQFPLHHSEQLEITLFDSHGIGGGTSGIAAGLLHPYAGLHAKLNWRGKEAFEASCELLAVAACHSKMPVTASDQGILRLASTLKQQNDYKVSPALLDPHVVWLDEMECQKMVPGAISSPALWIKKGITVYCDKYLQALWTACELKGTKFEQRHIVSLEELKDFSLVIIAAGALSTQLEGTTHIPLKIVKGQILELSWPDSLPRLSCALNSHAYIVMKPEHNSCLVGSSYEKEIIDTRIDIETAKLEILPKAIHILPALDHSKIIRGYAGLRAVTPNHLPFFKQIKKNHWMLTGMGSKGLLYHALLAKELTSAIIGRLL